MATMEMSFPGGLAVDAHYRGFHLRTDQSREQGGKGTAPTPFDLFLTSIGTCAGLYALRFCQQRSLETGGLGLTLAFEPAADGKSVAAVRCDLQLPHGFPDKYRAAIVRAMSQCTVKRQLEAPLRFEYALADMAAAIA